MNLMMRIILGIVKLALAIGIAGGLADLTLAMRSEAAAAHKRGLITTQGIFVFTRIHK